MPEVIHQAGNIIIWNQDKLLLKLRQSSRKRLERMGDMVVAQLQKNVGGSSPSDPGNFPGKKTGGLQKSFFWITQYEGRGVSLIVSFRAKHGWILEFGGTRDYQIFPKKAKVLSWVDRFGKRVFAKRVLKHPAMKPRPFLVRTLREMWPRLDELWRSRMI